MSMLEAEIDLLVGAGWTPLETENAFSAMQSMTIRRSPTEHCTLVKRASGHWLLTVIFDRVGQRSRIFQNAEDAIAFARDPSLSDVEKPRGPAPKLRPYQL